MMTRMTMKMRKTMTDDNEDDYNEHDNGVDEDDYY
jgi:hypothetical protein